MKQFITTLGLLCLLSACNNSSTDHQLSQKVKDLEARVTTLENQVGESGVQQNQAYSTSSPSAQSYSSTNNSSSNSFSTTSQKSNYSRRCLATTKKGTQCKRSAESGRSYCWQHWG